MMAYNQNEPLPEIQKAPETRDLRRLAVHEMGELEWAPVRRALFAPLGGVPGAMPVRAGDFHGVYRPGFDEDPFGVVTSMYRPVEHQATAATVEACGAPVRPLGGMIDGHGYHVAHVYEIAHTQARRVRGSEVRDRLFLVHDHTGAGSVRASVATRIGKWYVGSASFLRRIHVGEGERHVGSNGTEGWTREIAAMCEAAILKQDALIDLLTLASETRVTGEHEKALEKRGISTRDGKGDNAPLYRTLLDVAIGHHVPKSGALRWGVFSRALEGDALATIVAILGFDRLVPTTRGLALAG